jgi:thiol:disulfide interchange protein DsbC
MSVFSIRRVVATLLSVFLLVVASGASGQQSLREKLAAAIETASGNQLEIVNLKKTVLPTIYEVQLNTGEILYSDISGDYLFAGDMYRTSPSGLVNLSASTRQGSNTEALSAVPES